MVANLADVDVFEAMETCRAIRHLRPDPVPAELIDRILHAATCAPSPGNSQGWDFVVVDDQCVGRVIAVNSTCAIGVQFAPTDVGYRTALLVVTTAEGEYTSSVLSGEASREAVLSVPVDKVRAGDEVPFGGSGFRPGVVLSIGWADGRGETTTVTVSDAGPFLGVLPTSRSERAGLRRLVAQSSDQVATDDVRIQRRSSSSTTD